MDPEYITDIDNDLLQLGGGIKRFLEEFKGKKSNYDKEMVIAEYIHHHHFYAWCGDKKGEFMKWYCGKWYRDVEICLDWLIRELAGYGKMDLADTTRVNVKQRIKELKHFMPDQLNRNRDYINFINGFLDIRDWTFHQHGNVADYTVGVFTSQVPWEYIPDAPRTSKFIPWLYETLEGDWQKIDLLIKAIGYTFTLKVGYQKLFFLKDGENVKRKGKTGKSTFLNILCALTGEDNLSSISVQRLAKRFGTSGIVGRLLNFYADLSTNRPIIDTSRIKILIDDKIDYEIKGGGFFTVKNITKHWFSANGMPPVKGLDLAYCRRWCIITFDRRVPKDSLIIDFEDTIIKDPIEMVGIVAMAIDAYKELKEENGFSEIQTAEEVMDLIMKETDTVYRFVKEMCDEDPKYEDVQESLYQEYVEFAASDGAINVLKKPQFTADLYSKGFGKGRVKRKDEEGKRPYTYTGIKLKETEWEPDFDTLKGGIFDHVTAKPKKKGKSLLEEACQDEIQAELNEDSDSDEEDEDNYGQQPLF